MNIFYFGVTLTAIVYASFFEWTLHKYVMHRPLGKFRYPYETHALKHHVIFKADATYHLTNEEDKHTIPMAWWNGPVIIACTSIPAFVVSLLTHQWSILIITVIVCTLYFICYESIHFLMHMLKKHGLEKSSLFCYLNGHHLVHHKHPDKNFNVVLPLADLLLGTFQRRAKVPFNQARGDAVPDIQPPASS